MRQKFQPYYSRQRVSDEPSIYANLLFKLQLMRQVKCPHCGKEKEFSGNENRPFCSERCKLLDFGAWADEEFRLPAETSSLDDADIDAIEKALEENPRI